MKILNVSVKENSFRQSRTAGWQRDRLGSLCMDIIAYKCRPISLVLVNLHDVCTNKFVQLSSCHKMHFFSETLRSKVELDDGAILN